MYVFVSHLFLPLQKSVNHSGLGMGWIQPVPLQQCKAASFFVVFQMFTILLFKRMFYNAKKVILGSGREIQAGGINVCISSVQFISV